jgi:four helix bundle suffix protein
LLAKQMKKLGQEFLAEGGFTENATNKEADKGSN